MPLFKSHSSSKRPKAKEDTQSGRSPFHGVEIQCTADACDAAKRSLGTRYLSHEAPLLPLKECSRGHRCRCRYRHFSDRRQAPRRHADGNLPSCANEDHQERRRGQDRRALELPEEEQTKTDTPAISLDDTYYNYFRNGKDQT